MSLGDAYTLGVRITGDSTTLRQELRSGKTEVEAFGKAAQESLSKAAAQAQAAAGLLGQASKSAATVGQGFATGASAAERAATQVGQAGRRQAQDVERSARQTLRATQRTGSGFEDYMRRATKAQEEVARSSEDTSRRTEQSWNRVGSTLGRITGFAGMALLVRQLWQTGVGFHEFSQNSEVALSGMLGSLEQAKSFLADVLAFAKETPFSFPELTEMAQQLLAMNVNAKDIVPTLRSIGDAAASQNKGLEGMRRLTSVIGQINTVGKLGGETLRRLQEAGIPALQGLANLAGVSTDEYQRMVSEGLVPAETALAGLRTVINDGTDGINGQTRALGGFMAQIKGAGGITATTDSARSSFRNMSAALTESLLPAYVSFLRLAQDGMGVVQAAAEAFGALPEPLRNAALAAVALTVANRLLNTQARATGVWTALNAHLATTRTRYQLLSVEVGRTRAALGSIRATAGAAGTALLGAFGGPVGLAITGAAVAVTAFASAQSQARARIDEVGQTLDEVTGKITENTREWAVNQLAREQGGFLGGRQSGFDAAEALRLDLEMVTDAATGSVDALQQIRALTADPARIPALADALGMTTQEYLNNVRDVSTAVKGSSSTIDEAIRVAQQKARADGASAEAATEAGAAYRYAAGGVREFSEEQVKAQDAAVKAALNAFTPNLGAARLNIATADDVAQARDKVEQATRRVRDAEETRRTMAARDNVTESDRVRAAEAVADARTALQEATDELGETEARTDPVAQYRKHVEGIIEASRTFVQDIQTLADRGLNATDLASIISAGPEGSADVRKALLGDPDSIDFTNEARLTIDALGKQLESQARLTNIAVDDAGGALGSNLALAMRIAAAEGSDDTIQAIADGLGADPQRVWDVGRAMGLTFLAGLKDALTFQNQDQDRLFFPDGSFRSRSNPLAPIGMAAGGIYPGYTPGRDIGYIGISGGEAVMRPEWTRAVGPGYVDRMNAIARSSGVAGVQAEMRRYLGGFAQGGIPASPQVVTVPVSSTNEHYAPITIGQVVAQDVADFERQARHRRRRNNLIGG